MKFQFLPENFSRSENAPPFETRKIRHFEVERIFLENKKMLQEIVEKVLQLAKSNPDWGYEHIAGTMRYLGYNVSATTIRHILEVNGIVPDPERRLRGDWSQFIETQQYVTTSTDFAQVERLTPFGLVRESLLFFMDIGSREVCLGGIVHNPDSNWTTQIARNMCDMWDGFMLGKKYLIHDRDPLFNKRFDAVFEISRHRDQKIAAVHTGDECPHGEFHSGDQDRVSEQDYFYFRMATSAGGQGIS